MNSDCNKIKVSVLVPIYNVEQYLAECLESIIGQTLRELQIICINDGSTDGSLAIIESFKERDARIEILNKANSGYGDSMNQGLALCRGKYIGIVESDDWVLPQMFEDLYNLAEKHDVQVVKSNFFHYYTEPEQRFFYELLPPDQYNKVINPATVFELFCQMPAIWSALYRRDFLHDNQIRFLATPGAAYQDTSFGFKVWAFATRVYLTKQAYLHYRLDNESSSLHNLSKAFYVVDELCEMERFTVEQGIDEYLSHLVQERKVSIFFWTLKRLSGKNAEDFAQMMTEQFEAARSAKLHDYSVISFEDECNLVGFFRCPERFINQDERQGKLFSRAKALALKLFRSYKRQQVLLEQLEELTIRNEVLAARIKRSQGQNALAYEKSAEEQGLEDHNNASSTAAQRVYAALSPSRKLQLKSLALGKEIARQQLQLNDLIRPHPGGVLE
ncbi:MAG: glycosyltransferase [Coriobacteriia bacterium]|nr:glycosyltransferase [Coriobacteriia bacterium]